MTLYIEVGRYRSPRGSSLLERKEGCGLSATGVAP